MIGFRFEGISLVVEQRQGGCMGKHTSMFHDEAIVVIQVTYHDGLDHNGSNWGR